LMTMMVSGVAVCLDMCALSGCCHGSAVSTSHS
jgi:hypothetical protein